MTEHFGELFHRNGYVTAVMRREISDARPNDIWEKLSLESERVKWLAPGTIDMTASGRANLDFKDSYVIVGSEVTSCSAPNLFEFSWSGVNDPLRPIRFEIEQDRESCIITLSVSIPEDEVVARSCAGWEALLTMLQAVIARVSVHFPLDRFQQCREFFENQLTALMMSEVPVLRL